MIFLIPKYVKGIFRWVHWCQHSTSLGCREEAPRKKGN